MVLAFAMAQEARMNPNIQKDPAARSGQAPRHPASHGPLDDTAEPDGQFPTAEHAAPAPGPVDPEEAHVGATEEQVGDTTGPGAGYDETSPEQGASLPQGGQGMGQGRGANPGQQKKKDVADGDEADVEEKRQDPPASPNPHKREDPVRR